MRGLFQAGAPNEALVRLTSYTRERLLGEHVPYAVEAHPEGDQAHLSAESALYARIYIEGLFGIEPTGLASFRVIPHLPQHWSRMQLDRVFAFGQLFDLHIERIQSGAVHVDVKTAEDRESSQDVRDGQAFDISFGPPKLVVGREKR
ncbi:MAG: hypothetical protein M3Y57_21215 [Acidobacteriota bacterium]|nr:hypothetical protein [Acidobacteriota bacterium]